VLRYLRLITVVGAIMALFAFLGAVLGSFIDRLAGTRFMVPLATAAGVAVGYFLVWRYIRDVSASEKGEAGKR